MAMKHYFDASRNRFLTSGISVCLVLVIAVSSLDAPLAADESSVEPAGSWREAMAALEAQEWARAAAYFRQVTERAPESGFPWFRLGQALHGQGRDIETGRGDVVAADRGSGQLRETRVLVFGQMLDGRWLLGLFVGGGHWAPLRILRNRYPHRRLSPAATKLVVEGLEATVAVFALEPEGRVTNKVLLSASLCFVAGTASCSIMCAIQGKPRIADMVESQAGPCLHAVTATTVIGSTYLRELIEMRVLMACGALG